MKIPKALVIEGVGLNCEKETTYSLKRAGADVEAVPINQITEKDVGFETKNIEDYHIIVIEGGFSYADFWRAGRLLANKIKTKIGGELEQFIEEGKLLLGVCNGFQTLVQAGYLPDLREEDNPHEKYTPQASLLTNKVGTFQNRWAELKFNQTNCIWTEGINRGAFVNRHVEGNFFASSEVIEELIKKNRIVAKYAILGEGKLANGEFPYNPNGSIEDIAAICNEKGNVLGMMPHPEASDITNNPNYTLMRERALRGKYTLPIEGVGIQIFRNAVDYATKKLV